MTQAKAPARRASEPALPVKSLNEALPLLRRPFTPEAIRFKVQSTLGKPEPKGALIVAYIDARLVIERLNAVCGANWECHPQLDPTNGKFMWAAMTVFGVPRTDIGESPKGLSKDLVSDAIKRVAVQFGVGVSVYALPQITWWLKDHEGRLELRGPQGKKAPFLTPAGHERLRSGYKYWLDTYGKQAFGEPLDHGDAQGDLGEALVEEEEFAPDFPQVESEEAQAIRARIEELWGEISEKGLRGATTPARFNSQLDAAGTSIENLLRFETFLKGKLTPQDEVA